MSTETPASEPEAPATSAEASGFDQVDEQVGIFSGGPLAILARLGSLRVFLVLAVIWVIFQTQNSNFLTSFNLTNLVLQIAGVGTISIGVTLILLLGEIDLSVGAVSGLAAAVMAVLNTKHGWGPIPAIVAGLLVGTAIGALNGFFVTRFNIPSFVVTLAGLLAWQGALLQVLGNTGTINLTNPTIVGLANTFYSKTFGWILAIVVIGTYALSGVLERVRRTRANLAPPSLRNFIIRLVAVAVATIVTVAVLNSDCGIPLAGLIVVGLTAIFVFLTERTKWGRHVYSVGGNAEASRRAGIRVTWLQVSVFMLASTLAAA